MAAILSSRKQVPYFPRGSKSVFRLKESLENKYISPRFILLIPPTPTTQEKKVRLLNCRPQPPRPQSPDGGVQPAILPSKATIKITGKLGKVDLINFRH